MINEIFSSFLRLWRTKITQTLFVVVFAVSFFAVFSVSPSPAKANHCNTPFGATGYFFDNFQNAEYINNLLVLHFKLKGPYNDGRPWTSNFSFVSDECKNGNVSSFFRDVSVTPRVQYFSVRFVSPTRFEIWNDETNTKEPCANCTQDVPLFPGYYEIIFGGSVNGDGSTLWSSSYRISAIAPGPPIKTDTLPTPPNCQPFHAEGSLPYFFDNYERAEYVGGFLAYHFRFKTPYNDGRPWGSGLSLHNQNCTAVGSVVVGFPPLNTNFTPRMRYYSVRFSSRTHFDIWNDETNQIENCVACSVDIPATLSSGQPYSFISFGGSIDGDASIFQSTPFPIQEVTVAPSRDPVIIIPGILGSYLNRNDVNKTEVWPNILKMLLPGEDSYLNELAMELTGFPNLDNPLLLPTDIFRQIKDQDYFEGLIAELKNNGYQEGVDLFVFPYDWRWDITQSGGIDIFPTIQSLKEKIDEVKNKTGASKIDIIAHSLGGLVVKYYIKHFNNGSVDKFIDIATPHLGSPNAFKTLMYGDDMGIKPLGVSILNSERIKFVSQNMPSVYELLPSSNYFDPNNSDYSYYFLDADDIDGNGVRGRLNYDQTKEFLKNTGRNELLLNTADALHQDLDSWNGADFGVKTYNIIGCGAATVGKIFSVNKEASGFEYGLSYVNGDATVPLRSAEALSADKTYYANNVEHATMPSTNGIKQLVVSILKGTEESFDFNVFSRVRKDKNNCALSGKAVSFHSPVALHIYDSQGRHTGPTSEGDIENQIPGVQYNIVENNKFVFLPDGGTYTVVAKATGIGSFNARIQIIQNDQLTQTNYYNAIPISSLETNAKINISPDQTNFIVQVDQDGDTIFESQVPPSAILDSVQSQDLEKPDTQISISGNGGENNWYVSDVHVALTATDNNSGILKTEYSLDNGQTWNIYALPFVISQEGTSTVLYKSTDRAGNREMEKSQQIKIDKTPPEAKIFLNPQTFDLEIQGQDALSTTTTLFIAQNIYQIKDQAGHTLNIVFKKLKDKKSSLHVVLESLQYDRNPLVTLLKNALDYEWVIDKRLDELKVLRQELAVDRQLNVIANFKQKKNETEIKVVRGTKKDKIKERIALPGLVVINLVTDNGHLEFDY